MAAAEQVGQGCISTGVQGGKLPGHFSKAGMASVASLKLSPWNGKLRFCASSRLTSHPTLGGGGSEWKRFSLYVNERKRVKQKNKSANMPGRILPSSNTSYCITWIMHGCTSKGMCHLGDHPRFPDYDEGMMGQN